MSKIICFDCETTGVHVGDEILSLSMIDENSNVLFHEYFKPTNNKSWDEAEAVHGISPSFVSDKKPIDEYFDQIQKIFDEAELLVSYNGIFDLKFLTRVGVKIDYHKPHYDVMLKFAPIYGEYNFHHRSYKWQKLSTCAEYYGFKFKAHDSLEDVKATLYCYYKMIGDQSNEI